MTKLVKVLKLNNLQYNPNRNPQAYRRCVGEPFRIRALLEGNGNARVTLKAADGSRLGEANVSLPGTFIRELQFATPGARVLSLCVESGSERFCQDLRLEVMEDALHA